MTTNDPKAGGSENCLAIGTRLSDFEITGVLGEGGFGIVYVAYDHALQRTVAIKEYMPGVLATRALDKSVTARAERHRDAFATGLKNFINEARMLAQFDHPSLVKVYRFWEQNQTAYTAMQFYEGRTIKEILGTSPELATEEWCRKILRQMLNALEMLYTMNILHRDISPENIIVQENGDAVLLDFGSARQLVGGDNSGLTVILKPGYAPVEQYAGDNAIEQGPWTDIYALSAVLYYAITKQVPPASIARVMNDPMVPLHDRAPAGYSPSLLAAIDKGLAMQTHDRPRSIDEFRALLGIVPVGPAPVRAHAAAQRAVPPPPPQPVHPREREAAAPPAHSAHQTLAEEPQFAEDPLAAAADPLRPGAAPSTKMRLLFGAIAAGLLVAAGIGVFGLIKGATDDTIMLALPQPPATHQGAVGKEDVAKALDPTETLVEEPAVAAPPQRDPAAAPAQRDPAAAAPAPLQHEPDAPAPAEAPPITADAPPMPPRAPAMASYKLMIKPWGTVFVDGKQRGVSPPLKRLALPAGRHAIRIVNPNFADFLTTIEVGKSKGGSIDHDFPAASR